ncbi:MAG: hypothetical protein ACI4ET_14010, partial [Bilifractor sp.]
NVVNILNLDRIILGYDAVYLPDHYVALIEQTVNQHRFENFKQKLIIVKAAKGVDAQLYGAACVALNAIFRGKLLIQ